MKLSTEFAECPPATLATAAHRKFLLLDLCMGAGAFNFLLNYAIAWALFRKLGSVPMWGDQSIVGDTLVSCLVLPFLTVLIVGKSTAGEIAKGRFPALTLNRTSRWMSWIVARPHWQRGLGFGLLSALMVGLPALFVLRGLGIAALPASSFLWFKSSFAALLAALVTPAIGWLAMHRP